MSHGHAKRARHAESVGEALESGMKSIGEAGGDIYESALDETKAIGTKITRYVRKNPWRAVGIAAGAGLVIGFILRRKH